MPITTISGLQDATDLEKEVRNVVGLQTWIEIKTSPSEASKISILSNFIVDVFGMFFKDENVMGDLAADIDILTSIPDEDFELSDEIIDAIMGIDAIVEKEDVPEEIQVSIKTILVYMLEILQGEGQSNEVG
jgi:hypothetical protein